PHFPLRPVNRPKLLRIPRVNDILLGGHKTTLLANPVRARKSFISKGEHNMATGNPAVNPAIYQRALAEPSVDRMTVEGAAFKTAVLLAILLVVGAFTWTQVVSGNAALGNGLMVVGLIGGLIIAFVTIFSPKISPVTAPIYAAFEGLAL